MRHQSVLLASAALLALAPTALNAQTASNQTASDRGDDDTQDIVVTARLRSESVQSVPISVTALSGKQLEQRKVETLADVARFTPNLTFDTGARSSGGGLTSSIFIRGVGQSDFSTSADPGVGLYIDGVYYGRSVGSVIEALDLDHVEILRGPQGTLFGKNTIGGAINIASAMPTGKFRGSVQGEIGRFDERNLKGTIEFPITGTLAAKFSVSSRNRDGYTKGLFDGIDRDDVDKLSGRAVIRWTPTDDFTSTTIIDGTRQREHGAANSLLAVNPTATGPLLYNMIVAPRTSLGLLDGRYAAGGRRVTYSYADPAVLATDFLGAVNNLDVLGASQTFTWQFMPNIKLTSITAYRQVDADSGTDVDGTPFNFQAASINVDQHQFSQELRLNGTSFDGRLD